MNIVVTGSSGLIGSALVKSFKEQGNEVLRLVRGEAQAGEGAILWDPAAARLDAEVLEGADALIHLSGANIAEGRWTARRRKALWDSRVKSAALLAETLPRLRRPPRAWLCASAIGYYGDCGEDLVSEESPPGGGFLSELCQAWEDATRLPHDCPVRVVNLRFGVVLSATGGALPRMLLPFRLGLGGRIGHGKQYMSWVTIEDAVGAVGHALAHESLRGPINVASPRPVTNSEFTKTAGRVLNRPTLLPAPPFALRMMFGEMADALLLASTRAVPKRLETAGFTFLHPELEPALRHLLGK